MKRERPRRSWTADEVRQLVYQPSVASALIWIVERFKRFKPEALRPSAADLALHSARCPDKQHAVMSDADDLHYAVTSYPVNDDVSGSADSLILPYLAPP